MSEDPFAIFDKMTKEEDPFAVFDDMTPVVKDATDLMSREGSTTFLDRAKIMAKEIGLSIPRGGMNIASSVASSARALGSVLRVSDERTDLLQRFGIIPPAAVQAAKGLESIYTEIGETATKYWQNERRFIDRYRDRETWEGSFAQNPSFTRAISGAVEAIPLMGLAVAGGAVTGSTGFAYGLMGAAEGVDVFSEAVDKDVPEEKALILGGVAGAASMATEAVFDLFGGSAMRDLVSPKAFTSWIKRASKNALKEGTQEAMQEFTSNVVRKYGIDNTVSLLEGGFEAFVVGALTGGSMSMVSFNAERKQAFEAVYNKLSTDEQGQLHNLHAEFIKGNGDAISVALRENLEVKEQAQDGVITTEQELVSEMRGFENAQEFADVMIADGKLAEASRSKAEDAFNNRFQLENVPETTKVEQYLEERQIIRDIAESKLQVELQQTDMSDRVNARRSLMRLSRDLLGLKDADLKKVMAKDVQLMDGYEFVQFMRSFEARAVELAQTRDAKERVIRMIKAKNFQKVENYRKAMQLPPISKMSMEQVDTYRKALEAFQEGDIFLTQRQIETVDNSDLKGIRTLREARERLAEKIGVPVKAVENIKVSGLDRYRWDSVLSQKNPFYKMMVDTVNAKMLQAEQEFLQIEEEANRLAKKVAKSKKRTLTEKMIPQNENIMNYLEAEDKTAAARFLNDAELEYAHFIEQNYQQALEYLIKTKNLQRGRENYFTHMRMGILERIKEDGIVKAFKEAHKGYIQDQVAFNILDDDTGNILPLNKFFQYSMHRTGSMKPSKNVTKVFLAYMKTLKKKQALDNIIPQLDIYAQSLTPTKLTPRGLEMDRSLKKFVNEWLNNKKGRRTSFGGAIKQGGPVDIALRSINTFVSILDLGGNIAVSVASPVGEQFMTYQGLGSKAYSLGIKRRFTKQGKEILNKYKNFTEKNIWEELVEPDKPIGDRLMQGLFGMFHQATVEANKNFLLGTLTDQEFNSGVVNDERLSEMKAEMGRWRAVKGASSIFGSTSVGNSYTKYKTWAIPAAMTVMTDAIQVAKDLRTKKVGEALSTKEFTEIRRAAVSSTLIFIVAQMAHQDDDTFLGQIINRICQESMTLIQSLDMISGSFFAGGRAVSFLEELSRNLKKIITLETYKSDGRWGEKGDLKGIKGLQRQFTPRAIKQFQGKKKNDISIY